MAIVKMKKFTLLALDSVRDQLLKEFQRFGEVHFKNLSEEESEDLDFLKKDLSRSQITYCEDELHRIRFALEKLEPHVDRPTGLKAYASAPPTLDFDAFDRYLADYDYKSVCDAIRAEDDKMNEVRAETVRMKSENDLLKPWTGLDVAPSELDSLRSVKYLLGTVAKAASDEFRRVVQDSFAHVYVESLGGYKDDNILLIILPADEYEAAYEVIKANGFARVTPNFSDIPSNIIKKNNERAHLLATELSSSIERLKGMSGEYDRLLLASDYFETLLERYNACSNFLKTDSAVLIEGWVPVDELDTFSSIVSKICIDAYHLETEDVEKDCEDVPIKLKNNPFISAYENVTAMYSLPLYREVDPTPIFAPFYWLFFGLMMGDAGYGLILLIGTWLMLKFLHFKPGMTKMITMFFYNSFGIILGGLIYGSVFGYTLITPIPTPDGGFKAILDANTDIVSMLIAAIALGIIHIILGLITKGYVQVKNGGVLDAIFDSLVYIITICSGVALIISTIGLLPPAVMSIAKWLFFGSIVIIALTQGRSSKSIGGKIGNGLYSVYNLTGFVGDFVSYTRITALALSGAYIGYSFNIMANLIPGWLFFIFGTLIMLAGHLLNLALSALGAYVHTSRLQYVEFFGKFYDAGGVPFNPLKPKTTNIKLNK